MSNMSYCRFRNTLKDLRDCEEALNNLTALSQIVSDEERMAAESLVKLCGRIAETWEEGAE